MLEVIASTLKPGFEAAAALSAAAAIYLRGSSRAAGGEPSDVRQFSLRFVWVALAIIITGGVASVYLLNVGVFQREPFEGITNFIASLGAISLLALLWLKLRNSNLNKALVLLSVSFFVLPRATEITLLSAGIFNQIEILNTELLSNISGMLLGISIVTLFGILLMRNSQKISGIGLVLSASAILGILFAQQMVAVAQFGFAYGFLPLTPFLLSILAPLINNYDYFFYGLLAASSLYLLAYILTPKKKVADESFNPAQRRKHKASIRSEKRLYVVTALTLMIAGSLVAGESIAKTYQKMASELSTAEVVKATDGEVRIPIKSVSDGSLYRFSFEASDRTNVRFIVIHKGSGVYGVALDFCDICGPTGYYQRRRDVICKNCDVAINIPTIGIPGGCNPVPLNYRVTGKTLMIAGSDLEAAKQNFR